MGNNRSRQSGRSEERSCNFGTSLIRSFLCCINVVFILTGLLIFISGIWSALHANSFADFIRWTVADVHVSEFTVIATPAVLQQASYVLIAFGAIVSIISFVGCYGACHESKKCLIFYGAFLAIILLLEIATAITAAAFTNEVEGNIRSSLKSSIKNYYVAPEKNAVTVLWDYGMASLECCGVDSYEDFKESKNWTQANKKVPEACCVLEGDKGKLQPKDKSCPQQPSDTNSYWKKSCYKALVNWIRESKLLAIGIGVAFALFKLLGIFTTFYMWRSIRRRERSYEN